MINETAQLVFASGEIANKEVALINRFGDLFITGNIHTGWIYSPTIIIIGLALLGIIGWNIWLTYKLFKGAKSK